MSLVGNILTNDLLNYYYMQGCIIFIKFIKYINYSAIHYNLRRKNNFAWEKTRVFLCREIAYKKNFENNYLTKSPPFAINFRNFLL